MECQPRDAGTGGSGTGAGPRTTGSVSRSESGLRGGRKRRRGARRERKDWLPLVAASLLGQGRPVRRFLEAERRAIPGAAWPRAWRLQGWRRRRQFGSQGLASPRALSAPCSELTSSSTAPFLPGSRDEGGGHWSLRPRSSAGGRERVWSCCGLPALSGDSLPSSAPSTLSGPPLSGGWRWEGRTRARALPCYFSPQVFCCCCCSTRAPLRSHFLPSLSPHIHHCPCEVGTVGSACPTPPTATPASAHY